MIEGKDVLTEFIAQIYKLKKPKGINQCEIIKCCLTFLNILQKNDWKKLSLESITLLCPVILFVEKYGDGVSISYSFAQAVIKHD